MTRGAVQPLEAPVTWLVTRAGRELQLSCATCTHSRLIDCARCVVCMLDAVSCLQSLPTFLPLMVLEHATWWIQRSASSSSSCIGSVRSRRGAAAAASATAGAAGTSAAALLLHHQALCVICHDTFDCLQAHTIGEARVVHDEATVSSN